MSSVQYKLTILSPDGDKSVHVHSGSDQDWIEHQRHRPLIQRDMGRNNTESSIQDSPEADLALYQKLRMDGSPDLDEYEAGIVIRHLESFQVLNVERQGNAFAVKALVPGEIEREFRMRIPSARDLFHFRKGRATARSLQHGVSRIHLHLQPAATLFDAYSESGTDFPILWKARVCDTVAAAIDSVAGGKRDELF